MKRLPPLLAFALSLSVIPALRAELKLPAIISDHMVLQQKQSNPIWGWDTPGTKVTVSFAGQSKSAEADADGRWTVKLDPVPANAEPQKIAIAGSTQKEIQDVLVGEVWMCSGQSNMGFTLRQDTNGDLEAAASKLPNLRLIKVPRVGTQEPQKDFRGEWKASAADSASTFSAVGFLYGRYLHLILGVPVGLIDNSWGGSAAEAWVRRSSLESDLRFQPLMQSTVKREEEMQTQKAKDDYVKAGEQFLADVARAKAEGKPAPRPPQSPESWLSGNARPGNIFNGVVHPTLGYGIKGVIWYQGESNASRAYEYGSLFPFLIEQWRKEWKQGDFPFYWVQLADHHAEVPTPGDASWAELREAQTKTMQLPNTGQAVIIDLGEGKDVHPRNKHDVAARLVRWPLVKDYGLTFAYRSPEFKSLQIEGAKATVTLDCFGSLLRPFDVNEAIGFAICGDDKVWHPAKGKIVGKDQVELTSDQVEKPIAVRYAWADNPVCNLFSDDGLPVTPFRTDDFEMITMPKLVPAPAVP
ncbi:MAG: sialate O-acetylesterase [Chthoniobacter sp.]|jgi:sialate O-acetylesterase|nr:sialate O-acetylesterase [Chthoniobacter sp.]